MEELEAPIVHVNLLKMPEMNLQSEKVSSIQDGDKISVIPEDEEA